MATTIGNFYAYSDYVKVNGANLFTTIMLPNKGGKFPTVIMRSPYNYDTNQLDEDRTVSYLLDRHLKFLKRGYAVVFQHCRSTGKSDGFWQPYVNEREDTLALYDYIRKQSFYNKQLLLAGESFYSSAHYAASPLKMTL